MNTQDQTDPKGIFALFKGFSGAGKSVGALSFPNPYVFDYDGKMPAIAQKHFPKKSIEYDTYENIFLLSEKLSEWINNNNCPYETLIHDSITTLSALILRSIGECKGETTPQLLQTIKKTQAGKQMVELMGIDYYNGETRFVDWLLAANKILWSKPGNPKNIIFTAHILATESAPDIRTKIITKTRSLVTAGKKVAAYIPTQFDEVYLFGFKETGGLGMSESQIRHIMISESIGEDDAKTAYRLNRETDFTNGNLYELLQSQIEGAKMFL